MKILVCGSRNWVDQGAIEKELVKLPKTTILIHGACRGVDNIAGYVAKVILGWDDVRPYPADWGSYGPAAGVLRNQLMLDQEHPDENGGYIDRLYAFHHPGLGRGTKDMVERASNAQPPIEIQLRGF
jgi:hypothetical protein